MHWVIYTRVSTEDQAREGVSLSSQLERCRALLLSKGVNDPIHVEDAGFSAKDLMRPGAKRVLELVKTGSVKGICVWKLDRLSRSVSDLCSLVKLCNQNNIELVSVTENLDTESAVGRMFLGILGTFGQYEREAISERVGASMRLLKSKGAFVGGPVPAGLVVIGPPGNKKLIVHPEHGPIVAQVWHRCLEGESLAELSDWLRSNGVQSPRNRPWSRQAVARLIRQRRYIGQLIDLDTFVRAAKALVDRRPNDRAGFGEGARKKIGRGTNRIWVLGSVGRCALCGGRLVGVTSCGRHGQAYPYYRCSRKIAHAGCTARDLPAVAWERAALQALSSLAGTDGPLMKIWARERAANALRGELLIEERAKHARLRDGCQARIARIIDLLAKGDALATAARGEVERLSEEQAVAQKNLDRIEGALAHARIKDDDLEIQAERLRTGLDRLLGRPNDEQQAVISALLAEVHCGFDRHMTLKAWPSPLQGRAITGQNGCFVQPSWLVGAQGFEPR
jgi:site-specific DNA recombinase